MTTLNKIEELNLKNILSTHYSDAKDLLIKIVNKVQEQTLPNHCGLVGGRCGVALLYYYAAKALNDDGLKDKADSLIEEIMEEVNSSGGELIGSLYSSGAAGFAATLNHLSKNGFIEFDVHEQFNELHQHLFEDAMQFIKVDNLDFLHGAIGILYYFTQLEATDTVIQYSNQLVNAILDKAIKTNEGVWFPNKGTKGEDNDIVNFSLSHGMTGILLTLIKCNKIIVNQNKFKKIISMAVDFIKAYKFPATNTFRNLEAQYPFSFNINEVELKQLNRISWCYGDQNIALLFLQAGYMLRSFMYIHDGKQLIKHMMHRVHYEHTNVNENMFCHGYAGTASMYKAIYYTSYEPAFFEPYKLWINRMLHTLNDELESISSNDISLLEGLPGIGLTLADYILNDQGITWAELLIPFSQTRNPS